MSLNVRCRSDQYWKWLKWLTGNVFTSFFSRAFFRKRLFDCALTNRKRKLTILRTNKSFSVKTSYSVLYHVDFVENKNICSIWFFSEFGPIVIDYGKVQAKVSMKYDSWHKDALSKFGTMLGTDMSSFHSTVMIFFANCMQYDDKFSLNITIILFSSSNNQFYESRIPISPQKGVAKCFYFLI